MNELTRNAPEQTAFSYFFFERQNSVPSLLSDTAVLLRAFVNNVAVRCNFRAQNTPKSVFGRGFAELTALPPLAVFQGTASRQERERKGEKR